AGVEEALVPPQAPPGRRPPGALPQPPRLPLPQERAHAPAPRARGLRRGDRARRAQGPRALSPALRRPVRAFQEAAALAALAASAPAAASSSGARSYGVVWSDADEVALLNAAAAFRVRHGRVPGLPDMGALFDAIRGSIAPHIDQPKVYYKLKRLKSKFDHAVPSAVVSRHEQRLRDLCKKVWGANFGLPAEKDAAPEEDEEDEEEERGRGNVPDAAAMLPVATEVLDAYWKTDGPALSGVSLEKGLSKLATEDARWIEAKWRRQLDAEVHSQIKRHDLAKEVYGLLLDAIKGLGP
uniref:Glabrous enhancer-binding protein-like DBD domain-containing protein n=1 Tax=Aegilops tauschii subsp. strangulata TaxID=200361 RepID=A0A453PQ47_AEGTS